MNAYTIGGLVSLWIAVLVVCIALSQPSTFKDSECLAIPLVKVSVVPASIQKTHDSYIVTESHQRSVWRCVRD